MSTFATKRAAVDSPDARPSKRLMSSSPEEGELDDTTPPPPSMPSRESPPPPALGNKMPSKVPFPFKKKSAPPNGHLEAPPPRDPYSRPGDNDRRYRDDEQWWNGNGRVPRDDVRYGRPTDHWSSGARPPLRRETYDDRHIDDRSYRAYGSDVNNWERRREHAPVSPRPPPPRRTRSPSSPPSRSPSSNESPGRGKHRLPRPTVADVDSRGGYESDRGRDSRGRDFPRDRWPGASPVDDQYYRPKDSRDGHDRNSESLRRADNWESSRKQTDNYAPTSPRSLPRPLSPQSLHDGAKTPPPADQSLPETNSNDPQSLLPATHAAVKIAMPKKPPTPKGGFSPVSILAGKDIRKPATGIGRHRTEAVPAKTSSKPRRKPVQRTREEEMVAYGRMFQGCGQQSDYEVINKLGEGTFGEVHKAFHKTKGHPVALKRILMHNEKEGMPVTALREIKILKALSHSSIVEILDMFVVRSKGKEAPLSVYMVFPYMDHDLAGLLENERVKLSPSQIKLYMKQLLEGTEYMHRNHILHRDMKAANLLISNTGSLKIADFGLARAFDPNIVRSPDSKDGHPTKERKYTNCVVTRWYRPPELLLGARQYGGEVDMWGIGCVLGEMFARKPILPGSTDLDQLHKIWQLCGTPTQITWPNFDTLPGCEGVKRFAMHPRRVRQTYDTIGSETVDLLDKLLTCNPRERITATQALDHDYFWTDPLPADPRTLPVYEASHEFDKRGRRQAAVGPPPAVPYRPDPPSRPLPAPTQPHSLYFGRPPPPRESFRNGPPPPHHPRHYPHPPPHYSHGVPPSLPPPPATLPPLVFRPGQPLPAIYQQPLGFAPHLPARPSSPSRGGDRGYRAPRARDDGGGLNYG